MKQNALTLIDFYKADHRRQYPEGTEQVYSNFTPRSTKYSPSVEGVKDEVVFFGLQGFILEILIELFNESFFSKPKDEVVFAYKRRLDNALGIDSVPINHIAELHDIGYLPLRIRALKEGTKVKAKTPVLTIYNTLPKVFWLVNYLESIMSNKIWKPCNSATLANKYYQVLKRFAIETGFPVELIQFQGHDFSFRGMSGVEDAVMSGAGHLLSFSGTDTVAAIDYLEQYYGANSDKELVGCSVPATEHSVMCMGGMTDELATFKRLIKEVYPKGFVSIVSDTWDFWNVITVILPKLKAEIMARDGRVVIRPDSGDPVKIITGYKIGEEITKEKAQQIAASGYYCTDEAVKVDGKVYLVEDGKITNKELSEPEIKGAIECLYETFGGTITNKGYKLLDSHIGLIYGDSISLELCYRTCVRLKQKGFASGNVVLGIGSFTYEYATRDSLGFAMKATAGIVNGVAKEIFKSPKTDGGMKKSAKGYISVIRDEKGEFVVKDGLTFEESENNTELELVFDNGKLIRFQTLAEIRAIIQQS